MKSQMSLLQFRETCEILARNGTESRGGHLEICLPFDGSIQIIELNCFMSESLAMLILLSLSPVWNPAK